MGAIAGACVVLARRTVLVDGFAPDMPKIALLVIALGVLSSFKRLPEPIVVLVAALAGLILFPLVRS